MAEPTIDNLEIDDGRDPSVQEFIDNTLAALIHELSRSPADANISITLKRRASPVACIINPTTGALEASPRIDTYRKYSWPGKTAHEAWKFSKIVPHTYSPNTTLTSLLDDKLTESGCSDSCHPSNPSYIGPSYSNGSADLQEVSWQCPESSLESMLNTYNHQRHILYRPGVLPHAVYRGPHRR
jgi:hypothetical protein